MNRRGGHVDDRGVEDGHELTDKNNSQHEAGAYRAIAAEAGAAGKLSAADTAGDDVGHVSKPGATLIQAPGACLSWYRHHLAPSESEDTLRHHFCRSGAKALITDIRLMILPTQDVT
jgi:hypothetical protein